MFVDRLKPIFLIKKKLKKKNYDLPGGSWKETSKKDKYDIEFNNKTKIGILKA